MPELTQIVDHLDRLLAIGEFRDYYGPTMNAYAAAAADGRDAELGAELTDLFERQNVATDGSTRIPATYLRVTVAT